jgi:hypothetical protein
MDEKEMAKKLIDDFENQSICFIYKDDDGCITVGEHKMTRYSARKLAIIEVNNIINASLSFPKGYSYWLNVRKEIENYETS